MKIECPHGCPDCTACRDSAVARRIATLAQERASHLEVEIALRADLARVTEKRDVAVERAERSERAIGTVIDERDHLEDQLTEIHASLGCDGEWSNQHDCGNCAAELASSARGDLERERASHERDLSRASEITRGALEDRDAARASLDQALTLLRESESGKMCSAALEGEEMCSELPACYLHRRAAFLTAHPSPPKDPTR